MDFLAPMLHHFSLQGDYHTISTQLPSGDANLLGHSLIIHSHSHTGVDIPPEKIQLHFILIDIPCYTYLHITLCIKSPLLCIVTDPINCIVKYHNNMSSAKTINSAASHCKCYHLIGNVTTCTGSDTAWAWFSLSFLQSMYMCHPRQGPCSTAQSKRKTD